MLGRTWFLMVLFSGGLAAVGWAVYGSRLPPADFTFVNETEVASVDPALITGQPEGRIVTSIFEGLARPRSDNYQAERGVAEKWEISPDGRVYTFHLRHNAYWSNGEPVTARDFLYSIRRLIDPQTFSRYSYQAWYIVNANRYNLAGSTLVPGDRVEIELNPDPRLPNTVRGELFHGKLVRIDSPSGSQGKPASGRDRVFVVDIAGKDRLFQTAGLNEPVRPGAERCRQVLLDFREVGVKVIDDYTLQIRLINPTPYFLDLLAFYPFAPVNQRCLEKYGAPAWTRPENIVTNRRFRMVARRLRDRIRLVRSDNYWDREHVRLHTVDALSVDDRTTALNMYMTGMVDWVTVPPAEVLRSSAQEQAAAKRPEPSAAIDDLFLHAQHDTSAAERPACSPSPFDGGRP